MQFGRLITTIIGLAAAGTALAGTPIGLIETEGEYAIRAADGDRTARFRQSENTFYSGETVIARRGPSILNLKSGGGLGFTEGTEASVSIRADGEVIAVVESGSILYAFPDDSQEFMFQVGNFSVRGHSTEPQSVQVSRDGERVGTVSMLEGGNIEAQVRTGSLFISNGEAVRYRVDAGESVGLLDLPNRTIKTQGAVRSSTPIPPIMIQSPEQVGTLEDFSVRWEATDPVDGSFVVIAEEGAPPDEFESVISSDEGNILEFEAPGTPGDYEIRFIDGATGEIKRFVYLDVVASGIVPVWWSSAGAALGVAAGGTAVYIGSKIGDGDNQRSVSP